MSYYVEKDNDRHKEKILERSRNAKKDEGEEYAQLKGRKLGEYTLFAVLIPIAVFTFFARELVAFFASATAMCAFAFGQGLIEYRFTKRKCHLILTIVTGVSAIVGVISLLAVSLGWWEISRFFGLLR